MAAKRKNKSLEQLRQVARARQQAATRKVNRLQARGVQVAGTKYDVRRPGANLDRYTAKQLATYVNSLNNFVDRKTAFVADVHGRPISKDTWRTYKQLERKHNRVVGRALDKVKGVAVPGVEGRPESWETVEERLAKVSSKMKHAGNVTNNPYERIGKSPNNLQNEKMLKKLIRKMEKKLSGDFLAKDLEKDRDVVRQMTKVLGRKDLQKRINKLTDEQFNVLFNFWGFAGKISSPYELAKSELQGDAEPWYAKNAEDSLSEAERLLGYAEALKLGR